MATYEDASVTGQPVSGADTYRPLGHIMRDLKKEDEIIRQAEGRRASLRAELRQVAEAAAQYAENVS